MGFLNNEGVSTLWAKMKAYVDAHSSGGLTLDKVIIVATGQTFSSEDYPSFNTLLAVEFGAGIHHNPEPNPKANELGYGVGTFPGQTHAFEDGWYYLGEDDKWHYTHGVKATMPMYSATVEIANKIQETAKEVFG